MSLMSGGLHHAGTSAVTGSLAERLGATGKRIDLAGCGGRLAAN
jgi:hypothetical protein